MPHSQGPAPTMTTLYPEDRRPVEQDTIRTLLSAAGLLGSFIAGIYAFLSGRQKGTTERFEKIEASQGRSNERINDLERRVEDLPSKDDIHQLDLTLVAIKGDISTMRQMITGQVEIIRRLEHVVVRHEDHLLDGRK